MRQSTKPQPLLPACLPGFEHLNRYWDRSQNIFAVKLLPGEFYVSVQPESLTTVLGSCVSACIWDDKAKIGGMNHFMLPITDKGQHEVQWGSQSVPGDATRYGNYAMEHLINEILKHGGRRDRLQAKVFGGANVLDQRFDVGMNNCRFVVDYLKLENIPIIGRDLGNSYPRKIRFCPLTGKAYMKRIVDIHNSTIADRENSYRKNIISEPQDGDIELF